MATEQEWDQAKEAFVTDARDEDRHTRRPSQTEPDPLARQFAELTASLLQADTVAEVLEQVVVAANVVVPGADLVSVTLRESDGRFHTPVETDPLATRLDQIQYQLGEGPCVEAARETGPGFAISADLATESQWPAFGPAAAEHGVATVLSTVLLPHPEPPHLSGALNIYSYKPHGLDQDSRHTALLLATHASLALAHTHAIEAATLRETHLRQAIASRDVIGQAKGILMTRRGCSADEAFDILRETSNNLNVKLADLADTLAARHTELGLPAGAGPGHEAPS